MENIDYDTLKESMCEIFTKHGHRCPFVAKYYDKTTDKMACGKHKEVCRRMYDEYKSACQIVECSSDMSKRQFKDAKKILEECIKRRVEFTYSCCDNKIDKGHALNLHLLNKKLERCTLKK